MRKVITFNLLSLDSSFARPGGELDWFQVDDEFFPFSNDQLDASDMLLFGRVTYEGMQAYWTTPEAMRDDPGTTTRMNNMPKLVFSTTLTGAAWQNTRLIKDNVAEEVTKLKQQPGKDLLILGSANLTMSLARLGLVDEYRLIVVPVILGAGKPFFSGLPYDHKLKLANTRVFKNGNLLLYYHPEK